MQPGGLGGYPGLICIVLLCTAACEEAKQAVSISSYGGVIYQTADLRETEPSSTSFVRRARKVPAVGEASVLSVDEKPVNETAVVQRSATETASSCAFVCGGVLGTLSMCWLLFWSLPASGGARPALKLALLCLSFGACSWAMNVLNKAIVEVLAAPALITGAQMAMTATATLILAKNELIFDKAQVIKWSVVPCLFFGMLVSSFVTLEYLSLSLLVVVGNLGPLVTLPIETTVMPADKQPVVTTRMLISLAVMLVGAVAYCEDLHVSWIGLGFVLLNMVLAVANRVSQRLLLSTSCKNLTTETCMMLNNVFGFVPTLLLGYTVGEFQKFDSRLWFQSSTTVLLILSGIVGSGISYFAIAVQKQISATSFMVLQNGARMAVVVVGIFIFHDPVESSRQALGLLLNCCGAILYGKAVLDIGEEDKALKIAARKAFTEFKPSPFAERRIGC